jgi:uncharacterized protein YbjT (DUF2867 family)
MKMAVIGGTGRIGTKTVAILRQKGQAVVAASPKSGINIITGMGLKDALTGAQAVIDVADSPSFEDKAVLEFFQTSSRNLLSAENAAGVRHHVALSIVGIDRTDSGYYRAKRTQEKLIAASGIPYTIIRSTQFLEFLGVIADSNRMEKRSDSLPAYCRPSRRTMLVQSLPRWRSEHRATASSRSPARNEHRSTRSSPAI